MKPIFKISLALSVVGCAFAGQVSTDFKYTNVFAPTQVVVQFSSAPTAALMSAFAGQGATVNKQFKHVPMIQVLTVPAGIVPLLAKLPGVKYVSPNRPVQKHLDITRVTVGANMANQSGLTGQGIGVAVIDSGIDVTHADLMNGLGASRVVYSQDFTGEGITTDLYGHGTHVAGIVGGNGAHSSGRYTGMAPNVTLVNLRALDENGSGSDASVIAAIDEAITLQSIYNIRVINLSLGRPIFESFVNDPLCQAVEAAYQAGIVVVVAAGNDGRDNSMGTMGYGTISAPANDPWVITVGAMKTEGTIDKSDDAVASYSSKGPTLVDHFVKPDLVAPGNIITSLRVPGSTLDQEYPGNQVPPTVYGGPANSPAVYFTLNGTSMATPVVAGAAALLLQQNPAMNPDQVKARLMLTADKGLPPSGSFPVSTVAVDPITGIQYIDYYDVFTIGAGYLDITAALASTALAPGTAPSPVAVFNTSTDTISIVNDNVIAWDDGSGDGIQISWGDQICWGMDDGDGDGGDGGIQISWGDSSVWGASVISVSNIATISTATPLAKTTTQGYATIDGSKSAWSSSSASATSTMVKGEK